MSSSPLTPKRLFVPTDTTECLTHQPTFPMIQPYWSISNMLVSKHCSWIFKTFQGSLQKLPYFTLHRRKPVIRIHKQKAFLWNATLFSYSDTSNVLVHALKFTKCFLPIKGQNLQYRILPTNILDRDSSGGIAIRYRLQIPGIKSRWGQYFPHPSCRFQRPSGRRRGSAAARLLELRVRIPPGAWMFVL